MMKQKNTDCLIYHLTEKNIENVYYILGFKGYTVHPYGKDGDKKIGIAQKETQEIIVKAGDFVMLTNDKEIDPVPIMKENFNLESLLSKYGQLLINE